MRLAISAAVLLNAALLSACSDSSSPPANEHTTPPATTEQTPEAPKTDVAALKTELANASSADIMTRAEELWTAGEYSVGVELAQLAFDKDGASAAAYRLGTAYFLGSGVKKDLARAWQFLSNAALNEDRYSLYYRGMIKADPAFAQHNVAEARSLLEKAKEMGVKEAEAGLATLPAG